ncbi:MAG: Gfo/Idh/MocA family oxidoreductase [Candidatus Sumerlaeota bacterium]|nr:Gfo/Idh/MocA family oxidoreductase [Candidatus Sumerlaeota bacterium]
MDQQINRRIFMKAGASAAATAFTILRSGTLAAGQSPSEKLNIAFIGCGGRARQNIDNFADENIVALCDPNAERTAWFAEKFPQAKIFEDWRKCLDMKGIDAVVQQPPDHHHAFINVWAMNRGMHVYSEKPLANSVQEARLVRETYLKHKGKLAMQMGVQRHAIPNMARVSELIRDGAIGVPREVRLWCGRTPKGGDYLPDGGPVPATLNWDLWIGPSPVHPYNPEYAKGNCLKWNRFWDFGSGQMGDMGSHIMDIAWWGLDLGQPTSCECEGSEFSPATVPTWITAKWEHPANDWRPAVEVYWYDGGKMPGMPSKAFNADAIKSNGAIFKGDKGYLVCDFGSRYLMPTKGDMTQYKPRNAENVIPDSPGHHQEWINACKTGSPAVARRVPRGSETRIRPKDSEGRQLPASRRVYPEEIPGWLDPQWIAGGRWRAAPACSLPCKANSSAVSDGKGKKKNKKSRSTDWRDET